MNPFERFGIERLSPSSLNLWRNCPGLWALKYLAGYREPGSEAMWRGHAVEEGLRAWLEGASLEEAYGAAEERFRVLGGREGDELDSLHPMLDHAVKEVQAIGLDLHEAQTKIEYKFDGVSVPLIGFCDFIFDGGAIFDLKTTKRMPDRGQVSPDHGRQCALYSAALKAPSAVIYVTSKKSDTIPIGDNQRISLLEDMRRDAMALERFLGAHETATSAILSLPMDSDNWKWKQGATDALNRIYMEAA